MKLTIDNAIAAIDDFEIVGENNLSRDPTPEERFVLREFVARLFEDATQQLSDKVTDSEQYRMQMAGISTAALGYWKEGDEIHPDYDTLALHDVAKLYAKYAAFREALSNLTACVGMLMPNCQWSAHKDARALLDPLAAINAAHDGAK